MRIVESVAAFGVDVRQVARRLSRSPAFASLAIGTLIVGVGINAAMFGLMDALLFRPPVHVLEPADVVLVQFTVKDSSSTASVERIHYPAFVDVKDSGAFGGVAAFSGASVSIGTGADAILGSALLVSHEFFDVLGPTPRAGRLSLGDASSLEAGDQAIISHGFWQRHFGGAPRAVGSTLTIDGKVYAIAGVAPEGFQSLSPRPIDVWLPLDHATIAGVRRRGWQENRGGFWLAVVARLAKGTTSGAAEQLATSALIHRRRALGDDKAPVGVTTTSIVPGRGANRSLESRVSLWLAAVSALVLLIACANVLNLVLMRTFAQRRDYSVRLTLGASAWDLMRRSLAETSVIVIPGAIGALVASYALRNAIAGLLAGDIPLSRDWWDARSAAIAIGSAVLAFLLLSLASLFHLRWASRAALALNASHAAPGGSGSRRVLLAMQAALCLVLLFVAGLFAVSLHRVESLDLGADLNQTIQLTMNLPSGRATPEAIRTAYEGVRDLMAGRPEIERVALAEGSPYMSGRGVGPRTAGRTFAELWAARDEVPYLSSVGAGFFTTVGAHSLSGRDFNDRDRQGTEPVAIINAPLANYLWPGQEALGQCMWLDKSPACYRVVGVLGGVWKFSALKREKMAVYLPLAQQPDAVPSALFVRPRGDARSALPQIRSLAQSASPDLPAARAVVLHDLVDAEFRPWRLGTTVFSVFAAVALLVTSIGLYGVVAASTAFRVKEIGIRMALGARRSHVIVVVIGEGLASIAVGLVAGALVAAAVTRWMGDVLFQTTSRDPWVLAQTGVILFVLSAVAAAVPTMRALHTNPATVLRSE